MPVKIYSDDREWRKAQELFKKKYANDLRWFPFKQEDMKELKMNAEQFINHVGQTYNLWTKEAFMKDLMRDDNG